MITSNVKEIELLRQSGRILAEVLAVVASRVKPGVAASFLDKLAEQEIQSRGGQPSFKHYTPFPDGPAFPASLCVSVNDEVVHGLPNRDKILAEGDIVGLDLGLNYKEFFTDMAITVPVGRINELKTNLISCANLCLTDALAVVRAGNFTGDIGFVIESRAKKFGFNVVRDLVGHGVGRSVHEDPEVPCFGQPHTGTRLTEGLVIAIEPMINAGTGRIRFAPDRWTVKTADSKPSAHVEHTILVKQDGCEILTLA